ncbi:serine--tRNA ligase [Orientia chuto str. Dubai]|uniref:Serine--tRNA ligase n=1 Tax=Orientia chuto str. Dubai TaxID=1359168 RepID=A0A0F3MMW4_9RICK|nr:serine--tRNA ligase [Orientia chuto str. Dubai]
MWYNSNIKSPKHHYEIGKNLGMMDFNIATKMSGSRFVILKHDLAKLERALINFMIDIHTTEFNFFEVSPPYLVKNHAMYNVGQLPKFSDASFETTTGYRLIPTGEVPLTNIFANTTLLEDELPIKLVAFTPCFRSEVGSAGKDVKGMLRMHQFGKVELFTITTPGTATREFEYLTTAAEKILEKLGLPYRVVLLCSGDMGFAAHKTYDLEVWLPAQNCYREISSCSHFGDFQARRSLSKYKELGSKKVRFLHTINGSGLAIGRTIIAILENYQNPDGSVIIPENLRNYMGGQKLITPLTKKVF